MTLLPEQEDQIRRYLLGVATPNEVEQVETDLLRGGENVERLLLIEDELINDYALDALERRERELLEKNFFSTPERRERLMIAREMARQAAAYGNAGMAEEIEERRAANKSPGAPQIWKWLIASLKPGQFRRAGWKIAAYAALVIGLGFGIWQLRRGESEIEKGLVALDRAYSEQRPFKARISAFGYAPSAPSAQRGIAETQKVDRVALDRAKILLFSRSAGASDPEINYALGKYYLTQNEFGTAIDQFKKALDSGAESARLRSDMGAALLGKIERDSATETGAGIRERERDFNDCLTHINRALELDHNMREALFNRALIYRSERLRREARADFEAYLRLDSDSRWAGEVKFAPEEIQQELGKPPTRKAQ